MLILRRKKGESIDIAEKITVTVVRVSGNKVQIGIDAPKEVEVHREEITKLIKAKKQAGYIRKLKQPPTPQ
ncbi:carbon storage regulator CsrA [Pseudomonas caspiana]|uniref:Translational regulator CsrA n=1 Tax=Pseudomonas caspiana TaxID=1451454 RepID=A0A1Y3NV88_9PSED|nr:carbon storage regulator CsrA [Pseudomonas caspiana]OUM71540.1 hypothetical protein AUC60_22930 [Pseudomonas caspiana]